MSSSPVCWSATSADVFERGLASNQVRWSSPLLSPGWCQVMLDEVARTKPLLWPVLMRSLPQLNRVARLRAAAWLAAGYSPDQPAEQQEARLGLWKALVAPDMHEPAGLAAFPGADLLSLAVAQRWTAAVLHLLELDPQWSTQGLMDGQTPLHIAMSQVNLDMARTLIHAGADLQARDEDGGRPQDALRRALAARVKAGTMERDEMEVVFDDLIVSVQMPTTARKSSERPRL